MKVLPFSCSIHLHVELLNSPTRYRLPLEHTTRLTDRSLEITAEVPADAEEAESRRNDFLYSLIENEQEPMTVNGYRTEVSPFSANKWLSDLDRRNAHRGDRLAFVKYTPIPSA